MSGFSLASGSSYYYNLSWIGVYYTLIKLSLTDLPSHFNNQSSTSQISLFPSDFHNIFPLYLLDPHALSSSYNFSLTSNNNIPQQIFLLIFHIKFSQHSLPSPVNFSSAYSTITTPYSPLWVWQLQLTSNWQIQLQLTIIISHLNILNAMRLLYTNAL